LLRITTCAARPRCLLHVGPYKTGTTTLQTALYMHEKILERDGWHQPRDLGKQLLGPKGHKAFATVGSFFAGLLPPNATEPNATVGEMFRRWISTRASRHENIVLSTETLSLASVNTSLLASFLTRFDTTVVIGYRLFFDWILSLFRQLHWAMHKIYGNTVGKTMKLSRWLRPAIIAGSDPTIKDCGNCTGHRYFTDDLVRTYARHFDDIRLLPLGSEMVATFVCSMMGAPLTCASLLKTPAKVMNVKARPPPPPAPPGLYAGVCASQGGCLDQEIRAMLLARANSSATKVASFLPLQQIVLNDTELGIRLDALGLCFC